MDLLYKAQSVAERGTVCQLKNAYGHKSMKPTDVANSFNFVDNFTRFVTKAAVVYAFMKEAGIDDIKGTPKDSPYQADKATKESYFKKLCQKIKDEIWMYPSISEIDKVFEAKIDTKDTWCICDDGMYM